MDEKYIDDASQNSSNGKGESGKGGSGKGSSVVKNAIKWAKDFGIRSSVRFWVLGNAF